MGEDGARGKDWLWAQGITYVLQTQFSSFAIFSKRDNFCDFLFAYLEGKDFKMGYALKGKNLLCREQILSFMRWRQFILEAPMKIRVVSPESTHSR